MAATPPPLPGKAQSQWLATTPSTHFPRLQEGGLEVDVAIIGGGLVGLTAAFLLKEAGLTVAVLEADGIVQGVTGHTTAKLTSLHTLIYDDLIRRFGEARARAYGQANQAAIELVAELVEKHGIDCDFVRTEAYTFAETAAEEPRVEAEVRAALSLGLPASLVKDTPLPFPVEAAIRFDGQARFHPRKYLLALAEAIPGDGSHIFEDTRVLEVTHQEAPCIVVSEQASLAAREVIVASHYPVNDKASFATRLRPQRSYALALRLEGPVPPGLFIDTTEAFSLRPQPVEDGELAVVSGEGHPTGDNVDTVACYQRLELWARHRLPVRAVEYRWSTQDNGTVDRVPYVGRYTPRAEHLYVATGFGGWGMSNGTAAAMILRDLVLGRANPWAEVFDPNRIHISSVPELVRHNVKVAAHFVADRVSSTDSDTVQPGEGKVVHTLHGNVALYRDEDGTIHRVSPVCSHMGCIVHWNSAERSWDCPCHGSRFAPDGRVLHGPAIEPLEKR